MARTGQLRVFLVKWHEDAAKQFGELRDSLRQKYDELLRRLSAASAELEILRVALEERLRKESGTGGGQGGTGSHQGNVNEYIDKVHGQCKSLRPHLDKLNITVAQIIDLRNKVVPEHWSYSDQRMQRDDILAAENAFVDSLQELFDSIEELTEQLPGNGDRENNDRTPGREPEERAEPA